LQNAQPWLAQGDVFALLPCTVPRVDHAGQVQFLRREVSAVLLTEGCQLDKPEPGKPLAPRIRRLQFAPLRPIEDLRAETQLLLRQHQINPPEAVYLDEVDGEEVVAFLGEAFWLPAGYFFLELQDFSGCEGIGGDTMRVVARRNASRLCGMSEAERLLLHDKMTVFWTSLRAEGAELTR
jgi:hypothetical protein